ncbi:MAG: type II secretion system protein GspG [Desulfobacterales bacterium]|nr:type II secretion system protein GspG [Desulfobacterales bacterium]
MDPWGNDYIYTYPGTHGEYDLFSCGKDGKLGGEGEDADITSWAEASLIGQWFEYTPTSALDIAFDEKMPDK